MATTRQKTPVRVVPMEQIMADWQDKICTFELRYEMSSKEMAALVESNAMRHTAEVIQWYQTYYALKYHSETTPTTGTPGTTTEPSTTSA